MVCPAKRIDSLSRWSGNTASNTNVKFDHYTTAQRKSEVASLQGNALNLMPSHWARRQECATHRVIKLPKLRNFITIPKTSNEKLSRFSRFPCLQMDEISKICGVMGTFTELTWPEGEILLKKLGFHLDPVPVADLRSIIPEASPQAIDLISSCCQWNPAKRPTAAEALAHPFFKVRLMLFLTYKAHPSSKQPDLFTCFGRYKVHPYLEEQVDCYALLYKW